METPGLVMVKTSPVLHIYEQFTLVSFFYSRCTRPGNKGKSTMRIRSLQDVQNKHINLDEAVSGPYQHRLTCSFYTFTTFLFYVSVGMPLNAAAAHVQVQECWCEVES